MSSLPPPLLLRLFASGQAFAKQNYRALWVMICLFLYSRWLETESTPLPLSSIPMHVRKKTIPPLQLLPAERGQGSHPHSRTLPWGESLSANSCSGLQSERPDSNASHVHGHLHSEPYDTAVQESSTTSCLSVLCALGQRRGTGMHRAGHF